MTISSQTNKVIYVCDGNQTVFPYTFKILQDEDIEVILVTIVDGTETTLTLTSDYTVSGAPGTGNVTTVSTYSSAYKLILRRGMEYTQETDYIEGDPFPAETHETALDKLTMLVQQQQEQIDRSLLKPSTETTQTEFPSGDAYKVIAWDETGTNLINANNPTDAQAAAEAAADAAEASATDAETAQTNAETAQTNAETAETGAETAESNAEGYASDASDSADEAAASVASVPTFTRDTFDNSDLSSGVLTINHDLDLSAPYTINVFIFDNNNEMVLPDSFEGQDDDVLVDLSSYETITGTWGYAYFAG